MTPKDVARIKRILDLRKRKAEEELHRVTNGITAGQALRDRLQSGETSDSFRQLTIGYVTRTVRIIDRGLAVLKDQSQRATAELLQLENNNKVLGEKAGELIEKEAQLTGEEQLLELLATSPSAVNRQA